MKKGAKLKEMERGSGVKTTEKERRNKNRAENDRIRQRMLKYSTDEKSG
jgi:hypothetical protein